MSFDLIGSLVFHPQHSVFKDAKSGLNLFVSSSHLSIYTHPLLIGWLCAKTKTMACVCSCIGVF